MSYFETAQDDNEGGGQGMSNPFDPFDYPFDYAQGYGFFRAGCAQDRYRTRNFE